MAIELRPDQYFCDCVTDGSERSFVVYTSDFEVDLKVADYILFLQARGLASKTLAQYVPKVVAFLNWCAKKRLHWTKVSVKDLWDYARSVDQRTVRETDQLISRSTADTYLLAVSQFMSFSAGMGYVDPALEQAVYGDRLVPALTNSKQFHVVRARVKRMRRGRKRIREPRVVSDETWDTLLASTRTHQQELALRLAHDYGLRCGEILSLKVSDFHIGWARADSCHVDGPHLHIRGGATNGRRDVRAKSLDDRWLPLRSDTLVVLQDYVAERALRGANRTEYLFVNMTRAVGDPMTYSNLERMMRRLRTRAGTLDHTLHSYRHTFGTNLNERAHSSILEIAEMMGHRSPNSSRIYVHPTRERRLEALRKAHGLLTSEIR
jgi:integrase